MTTPTYLILYETTHHGNLASKIDLATAEEWAADEDNMDTFPLSTTDALTWPEDELLDVEIEGNDENLLYPWQITNILVHQIDHKTIRITLL